MLRDDLHFRGQYQPVVPGQFRVMRSDHGVLLVDRAGYDPRTTLRWEAEAHDSAVADVVLTAFRQAATYLAQRPEFNLGCLLPEQFKQVAADRAGRAFSDGREAPSAVEHGLAYAGWMACLPAQMAVAAMIDDELVPDCEGALQAQLFLQACAHNGNSRLLPAALDLRDGSATSFSLESLDTQPDQARRAQLASRRYTGLAVKALLGSHGGIDHTAVSRLQDSLNYPVGSIADKPAVALVLDTNTGHVRACVATPSGDRSLIEAGSPLGVIVNQAYATGQKSVEGLSKERAHEVGLFAATVAYERARAGSVEPVAEALVEASAHFTTFNPVTLVKTYLALDEGQDTAETPVIHYTDREISLNLNRAGLESLAAVIAGLGPVLAQSIPMGETIARAFGAQLMPKDGMQYRDNPVVYMALEPGYAGRDWVPDGYPEPVVGGPLKFAQHVDQQYDMPVQENMWPEAEAVRVKSGPTMR
ncbi:hypothetical protein ACWATP_002747 [Pseudomonas aeruginosa]|nr:hypothetical protein [Pseudomonas aeruginosa]HCG1348883.1 hypothetical protein [Pseudomonas aeruginosa]